MKKHYTLRKTGAPGHRNYGWKGGVGRREYHSTRVSSSKVDKTHRLVMQTILGRPLRPGEHVHHIDGEIRNNDPSNLALFPSNGAHLSLTEGDWLSRLTDPSLANQGYAGFGASNPIRQVPCGQESQ